MAYMGPSQTVRRPADDLHGSESDSQETMVFYGSLSRRMNISCWVCESLSPRMMYFLLASVNCCLQGSCIFCWLPWIVVSKYDLFPGGFCGLFSPRLMYFLLASVSHCLQG